MTLIINELQRYWLMITLIIYTSIHFSPFGVVESISPAFGQEKGVTLGQLPGPRDNWPRQGRTGGRVGGLGGQDNHTVQYFGCDCFPSFGHKYTLSSF